MPEQSARKKILIVDDEMDMRIFLSTLFKTSGYNALAASDGDTGYKKAESERPDLIVLDIMMPHEGGAAMYKKLKSDKTLSRIPVIILSAVGEETFQHYITMLNAQSEIPFPPPDAYIEKPPTAAFVLDTAKILMA